MSLSITHAKHPMNSSMYHHTSTTEMFFLLLRKQRDYFLTSWRLLAQAAIKSALRGQMKDLYLS